MIGISRVNGRAALVPPPHPSGIYMEKVCSSKPEQLLLLRHLQSLSRTIIQNPNVIFHGHLNMEQASEAGLSSEALFSATPSVR